MWCLFFYIQKEFLENKRVDDNGCLLIESNEPKTSMIKDVSLFNIHCLPTLLFSKNSFCI